MDEILDSKINWSQMLQAHYLIYWFNNFGNVNQILNVFNKPQIFNGKQG